MIVLSLERPTFGFYIQLEMLILTPKIKIFGQNFTYFSGFELSFLPLLKLRKALSGLFKDVLELCTCLNIVFNFEKPVFYVYFQLRKLIHESKIRLF